MKLFHMEVRRGREGRVLIAHFVTQQEAVDHVTERFKGWEIRNLIEIPQAAHFQIADRD